MPAITALRVYIIYFDIFKLLIRIIPFLQQSLCPLEEKRAAFSRTSAEYCMHSNRHSATQFLSMGHFSIIFVSPHNNSDIRSITKTRSGEKKSENGD